MSIFKVDLKRAILSKKMLLSISIGLFTILLGMLFEPIQQALKIYNSNSSDLSIEAKTHLIGNSLNKVTLWYFGNYFYLMLFPMICSIPFSLEYALDKRNGFNKFQIIRTNYKSYIISKLSTSFISGFISILTISSISIIFISIFDSGNEFRSLFFYDTFLGNLSTNNFNLYVIIHTIIAALFAGLYSIIGMVITSFTDKILLGIAGPFLVYYLGAYIFSILKVEMISLESSVYFYLNTNTKGLYILTQFIILLAVNILIFLKRTYWSKNYE